MEIPKQASQKILKTWSGTKLAKKQLKFTAKRSVAAGTAATTAAKFNPAERDSRVRNNNNPNPAAAAAPPKRNFYPDYDHITYDPNSTVPLSSPMDPLNFWRVNELSRAEEANRFPYSAIVRVAVVDRFEL